MGRDVRGRHGRSRRCPCVVAAPLTAHQRGPKRFSIDERWLQRCDRKVIGADLAERCGCPKQFTDQLAVAMAEEECKSEGKKGGVLRRSELRLYLESNRTAATKLGFKLHPEHHDSILLCPGAFGILKGYPILLSSTAPQRSRIKQPASSQPTRI